MKILLYSHEFLPFAGGIATYCYELACGLSETGHEVTVIARKTRPWALHRERFRVEWIEPHDLPAVLMLRAMRRFYSVVVRVKPAAIIVNDRVSLTVTSMCHSLGLRNNVIPVVHGFGSSHMRVRTSRNPLKRILDWQIKRFYRSRDLVICVSSHMRSMFLSSGLSTSRQRVVVVHNGIKNRFDREAHSGHVVRRRLAISSSATVLLTLARLARIKGQDVIIKALPRVIEKHSDDIVYICAGKGPYGKVLAALAVEYGVAGHVIFPGQVPNDESKYAYYDACDLFVMPSRFEAFGLSFVEAWHAAKPVLGGNRGGPTEIIEDGVDGVIVEPDDVITVADSIVQLIQNPERLEEMGRRGHVKAMQKYSRIAMADKVVQAIDEAGASE